ncbi:ribonuclease Z [Aureibacillus halotolerans]|uniref:Ribonuclease Z n=1 Tax=Aureibacillus halotolerans TaxID=1508390 RepID=A0A4R6U5W6_9BACI|nr:ribonuclease Z [Aureibacillus halotolerans]TDQ41621.1 RNAse Z [Aureibacillus halotolerans]
MKLTFLGTGAGLPSKSRNVSSLALQWTEGMFDTWLFDCGEATQIQLLHTPIKPGRITKIFISHLHGDHIFGLPGFLSSRSFQGGEATPLEIYGPEGIAAYIETSLQISETKVAYPIIIHDLTQGILFENDVAIVEAKSLQHTIPSYGFRIVEKDKPGALLVDRLVEDGVQPGPHYQQIKDGQQVALPDGRVLNGKEYIGEAKKGRVVTILGDTSYCEAAIELAEDADLLIHEATYAEADKAEQAKDYGHSTALQAAEVAHKARVRQLVLTHLSSRYQDEDELHSLLLDARNLHENMLLASDLLTIELRLSEKD